MDNKFFIATAITYTSKKPHIGNVYEIILSDAIARYKRMMGKDVHFLTGTDEFGQKIENYASEAGEKPAEYVDKVAKIVRESFDVVGTSYDQFIRTTEPNHIKTVQKIFKKLYDQGDIYKSHYEGLYCVPDETFYTEAQAEDGKCPECGRELVFTKEEAYFFKMSKYEGRLAAHIEENPDFIAPESRRNEMVNNFIKPGLMDLCVSRTSFKWGIPVSFDEGHVVYVWLDALTNYISALGYDPESETQPEKFVKNWPCDLHVIGKDVLRFHAIIWPCVLMALDLPLPKKVYGHPWLLSAGDKMSKSVGNVIYADDLVRHFSKDGVRYFLLANMPYASDGNLTYELVLSTFNSDLANTYGNLVSRSIAMTHQYMGGILPEITTEDTPLETELNSYTDEKVEKYFQKMESYHIAEATGFIMDILRASNKYVDDTQPWILGKDEAQKGRLATVLSTLINQIRKTSLLLAPIIPDSAELVLRAIGLEGELNLAMLDTPIPAGTALEKIPPLFARIDDKKKLAEIEKEIAETAAAINGADDEISIDDFAKVKLIAAKIISAEAVDKSDKLLLLKVNDGKGERQVVSGIAEHYSSADLIGKTVVLVANLKPVKLRGQLSQGMILASDKGKGMSVIFLDDDVEAGEAVR